MDSYTNLTERYRCDLVLSNGTGLPSNEYDPMSECEHEVKLQSIHTAVCMKSYLCPRFTQDYTICVSSAAEVTLTSLALVNRTNTTLSVTWPW